MWREKNTGEHSNYLQYVKNCVHFCCQNNAGNGERLYSMDSIDYSEL